MAEFKIPELGENIEKGDVVKVLITVGDVVKLNQTVLELETDKAVVEVPSSVAGKVTKVSVKVGDKVKTGHVVFEVEGGAPEKTPTPAKSETQQIVTPAVAAPTATTPVSREVPLATQQASVQKSTQQPMAALQQTQADLAKVPASPSVRRFAREIGVDITQVLGTGSRGRVTEDDIKSFSRKLNTERVERSSVAGIGPEITLPDFTKWGDIERKPMSAVRRKTARHLSQAWYIPHVTQCDKADITELEKLRKENTKRAQEMGGKLTTTVIILKIIANALKVFPQFNASVDMATDEIILKKYYNIGVAVDTDRGLLVPVIRDVDKKNIIKLSMDLNRAAELARDKKLGLEDMQGATFTISNLGGLGGTYFTPIINAPEVAILGLSRGQIEPVYIDGKFEPRLMLPLSLSYDHRIIDGADAIRFLRWVAEALQQPFLMDLEG